MTIPFKPRVAQTICRIDRKTQAVTASVNFEDIDLTIDGKGSEYWDYEYMFVVHSSSSSNVVFYFTVNNLSSYSRDYMRGSGSSAFALAGTTTSPPLTSFGSSTYPPIANGKITGYIGNKRHIGQLRGREYSSTRHIQLDSYYTDNTSTEITSFQIQSDTTATITYSLIITAVPKIQYNPNAVLIKHKTLSAHTADIIFGGANDTEGVDDLDGDVYDYYVTSSGLTDYISTHVNEDTSTNRVRQQIANSSGSLSSSNANKTRESIFSGDSSGVISKEVGRKGVATFSANRSLATQQVEIYSSNPDTSTKMTSLLLRPTSSISGNVQLYAVPKGYNADLTPWTFRQVVDIAGDFSVGHSFEIPDWAMFMKVDFVGNSNGVVVLSLDFDNLGITIDRQYLSGAGSTATASFDSANLIAIDLTSNSTIIASLTNGSNRPILSKTAWGENSIVVGGHWAKNSSTVFTSAQIKASNTNTINGRLVVSFI